MDFDIYWKNLIGHLPGKIGDNFSKETSVNKLIVNHNAKPQSLNTL